MSSLSFLSNEIQNQKHILHYDYDNEKIDRLKSSNQKLLQHVTGWVLQYSGRLRVKSFAHKLVGGTRNEFYYIKETVKVQAIIEVWQMDAWEPLPLDFGQAVWLEFHRLDPFIRVPMVNEGGGKFTAEFMVPDTYGVFNFIVKMNRLGYTQLETKTQVTVRPLRHDMYERFIVAAYPYYLSAFSMMFGVFLLSFAFLYNK